MITTLDHVGLIVPRLDEAARIFAALGFVLTARAEHTRVNARGEVESAGSVQHSVMLEDGYIELQEITDPEHRHLLSPAAAKYFGLHIIAFGTGDAERAHDAVQRNGLATGPVLRWGRAVHEPEAAGEARFAFFVAPYRPEDEALLCWVQHLTPDLIRSPRLTAHPNAARFLAGISVLARNQDEARRLRARYVACGGETAGEGDVAFGAARLSVRTPGALPAPVRGPGWDSSPSVVGLSLRVDDAAAFVERARAEGFGASHEDSLAVVDLSRECGITLILEASERPRA